MSSLIGFSEGCLDAFRHLRETREINTVILQYIDTLEVLVAEVEGNLTHDELIQALPEDKPRLVIHELSFATREGKRRNEQLLVFWMPPGGSGQEEAYTALYTVLKGYLADVHVRLTARRADELDYHRLVALAG
ncbi:hypothetical protein HYE82_02120 [Streptomyces sp. BR123]|uniref:cofilin family protein n=1 Tax=Streptomyces sp. BR123 TaxID=2749828 RepID=UPI0015C48C93|nr:cofilin family protein [Streptomyces sp. BR123]NXY93229.1 hypothetical protein [Streptomyces sp. BR123]